MPLLDVLEEHAEEAASLYERRRYRRRLALEPWSAAADLERRLDAHLDGLVVGGEAARGLVEEREGDDPSARYVALRLACRTRAPEDVLDGLRRVSDLASAEAAVEALLHEPDSEGAAAIDESLGEVLGGPDRWAAWVAAVLVGQRRTPAEAALVEALDAADESLTPVLVRALGLIGSPAARGPLNDLLRAPHEATAREAATALLRLGERGVVTTAARHLAEASWAPLALGLAGGERHAVLLADMARTTPRADILAALGVAGSAVALDVLLNALEDPILAETAAASLHVLTGAAPLEQDVLPFDDADEHDSPHPSERDPSEGEVRTRLAQPPALWADVADHVRAAYSNGVRYRLGAACDVRATVATLASPWLSCQAREQMSDDLAIRYGTPIVFHPFQLVADQVRAIEQGEQLATGAHSPPGAWCFQGTAVRHGR